jgi:8-oxo-dGTP pyrophosphatase MutT (NUDIX family)
MGYIEELRELIGHRPIIMVGATVLITDPEGRLLLMRRLDNGCWGVPGGALEPGESLEQTARRETREETGLEIGKMSLFGVFSGPELFYEYPNGDQVYNVSVVYLTNEIKGEINLNPFEHTEISFFETENLPSPLSPPVIPIIRAYRQ